MPASPTCSSFAPVDIVFGDDRQWHCSQASKRRSPTSGDNRAALGRVHCILLGARPRPPAQIRVRGLGFERIRIAESDIAGIGNASASSWNALLLRWDRLGFRATPCVLGSAVVLDCESYALRYLFEDYVLDTGRRELRRGGDLQSIEPKVFDLLAFVVGNCERVVSRDDLIATVWDGRIVSESTLATCINAARSAIGDSGEGQRLIKTL